MPSFRKPLVKAVALGAAFVGSACFLQAQYNPVRPGTVPQAPQATTAGSQPLVVNAPQMIQNPNSGWGGWGNFSGFPYPGRGAGGALTGKANVIQAQGQLAQDWQNSRLTAEQVTQSQMDTRRKTLNEWQYEQALQPTLAEVQQKAQLENLNQMRGNPSDARIWSGEAQNALLANIQRSQKFGNRGPSIPLDPAVVSQINLTNGTSAGALSMFTQGPRLQWPLTLRAPEFEEYRKSIDTLAAAAVQQAGSSEVDFGTAQALRQSINKLQSSLKDQIDDIPATDYIRSTRFIGELQRAVGGLGDPSAGKVLSGQWQPRAATVDQLVAELTSKGLRFAPARSGSEAAYNVLYQALWAFDSGVSQVPGNMSPGLQPPDGPGPGARQ